MCQLKGKGECLKIKLGVRQGCGMSPWLFNLFMDGMVREIKTKLSNVCVERSIDDTKRKLNFVLFAIDTVLLAESKKSFTKIGKDKRESITRKESSGILGVHDERKDSE